MNIFLSALACFWLLFFWLLVLSAIGMNAFNILEIQCTYKGNILFILLILQGDE